MASAGESLTCSFCDKPQEKVGKLISSPSHYPRAYICDECVAICVAIIEDDQAETQPPSAEAQEPHPLLTHPLASRLLSAAEDWIHAESLGGDGSAEIVTLREIASKMLTEKPIR